MYVSYVQMQLDHFQVEGFLVQNDTQISCCLLYLNLVIVVTLLIKLSSIDTDRRVGG